MVPSKEICDTSKARQDSIEAATATQNGSHFVDLFFVHVLVFSVLQLLNKFLSCIAEKASHPVDHSHAFGVVGLGTPDLLEHLRRECAGEKRREGLRVLMEGGREGGREKGMEREKERGGREGGIEGGRKEGGFD